MATSTRILELLGLLQGRRHWPAAVLADRLGVSARTLRRDIEGLQKLGYPIASSRGTGGGYQLAAGASLPPLVLTEEEATAVVLGLKHVASGGAATHGDGALSAMAKIVQVLPAKIRSRINSLGSMTSTTTLAQRSAITDVADLTTLSLACRDSESVQFEYRAATGEHSTRRVDPYRIVNDTQRMYLIAYDVERYDWRTFRVDRMQSVQRTRRSFHRRTPPFDDPASYVRQQQRSSGSGPRVRITIHAPSERVSAELSGHLEVEAIDAVSCSVSGRLVRGAESMQWVAFALGAIGAPFVVHEPQELQRHLEGWGRLFLQYATGSHAQGPNADEMTLQDLSVSQCRSSEAGV